MRLTIKTSALCLLTLLAVALSAASSFARSNQISIFRAEPELLSDSTRAGTLDKLKSFGVDVVGLIADWRKIAPAGKNKPSGFDGADPDSYAADRWHAVDSVALGTASRGMRLLLLPTAPAPDWATGGKSPKLWPGSFKPSISEHTKFITAVAKRYSGTFKPAGSNEVLPKVEFISIDNEPNWSSHLQPQWIYSKKLHKWIPFSPHYYRKLYLSASKAVHALPEHQNTTLFVGDTSPIGYTGRRIQARYPILGGVFWREFFCLDSNLKTFGGYERKVRGCPASFKIDAQGVAHHPYAAGGGLNPLGHGAGKDDLTVGNSYTLINILKAASKRGRISGKVPIYFSEFGAQTNPPDARDGVPLAKQAQYINEAEFFGYRRPKVNGYSQYLLMDVAPRDSFQSGLEFKNGTKKQSFDAFRLPIYVKRQGANKVMVWGCVRPKERPTDAKIQSGGINVATVTVSGSSCYFTKTISGSGAGKKSYRLSWTDKNNNTFFSRTAKPSTAVK